MQSLQVSRRVMSVKRFITIRTGTSRSSYQYVCFLIRNHLPGTTDTDNPGASHDTGMGGPLLKVIRAPRGTVANAILASGCTRAGPEIHTPVPPHAARKVRKGGERKQRERWCSTHAYHRARVLECNRQRNNNGIVHNVLMKTSIHARIVLPTPALDLTARPPAKSRQMRTGGICRSRGRPCRT